MGPSRIPAGEQGNSNRQTQARRFRVVRRQLGRIRTEGAHAASELLGGARGVGITLQNGVTAVRNGNSAAIGGAVRISASIGLRSTTNAAKHALAGVAGQRTVSTIGALLQVLRNRRIVPALQMKPGARRIAMLTISRIEIDPRINKVASSLADAGYDVEVLCLAHGAVAGAPDEVVDVRPGVRYVKVPITGSFHNFWQTDLLRVGRQRDFDAVHVNDLTTALVGWTLASEAGVPMIYDAHEMWTENVELRDGEWVAMSQWTRSWSTRLERMIIEASAIFITVSDSIQREYLRRYSDILSEAPLLLPNYPSLTLRDEHPGTIDLRSELGLPEDAFVILYLGGVNQLRNIETVVYALQLLPARYHFVVQGPGHDIHGPDLMNLAEGLEVDDRLHVLPGVDRHAVVAQARQADCGIVMLTNVCLNFYWFFPNKLFEYSLAGIPVAVSAFPDVKAYVDSERCGVTFDPESPSDIAAAVRALADDPDEAAAMGARGREAIHASRNWERVVGRLIGEYQRLEGYAQP